MRPWNITLLCLLTVLAGCSSNSNNIKSDLGVDNAPDWVNEGTRAVNDKNGRFVQGVGSSPAMDDISLQKSTADNRARAEVARVISTFIDSTIEDYSATTGSDVDVNIERQISSSSEVALSGAKIMAHWIDPKTGTLYAFAELDLKQLEQAIENAEQMNAGYQTYMSTKLDANFDRFVGENK